VYVPTPEIVLLKPVGFAELIEIKPAAHIEHCLEAVLVA
jgi:hypothetical protein